MSSGIRRDLLAWAALAWLGLTAPTWADDLGPICPDRPGKGTSPCTLAAGHAQIELGLFDESFQRRSGVTIDSGNAGAVLAKYGAGDNWDVEAGMALYQFQRVHDASGTVTASGVGDLFLHAKYNPLSGAPENESSPFAFVLDPYIKLPTAVGGLGNGAVEGGLVAPMSYDLGGNWSLAMTPEADALLNASGGGHHANLVDVLGLGKSFGPLSLGVEAWTSQNLDPAGTVSQYSFDMDAAFLIGNDTQLDGGVNLGLNKATPDMEIYFGVSRRF
jgi:Putative MetA-pathway of phenol degradation